MCMHLCVYMCIHVLNIYVHMCLDILTIDWQLTYDLQIYLNSLIIPALIFLFPIILCLTPHLIYLSLRIYVDQYYLNDWCRSNSFLPCILHFILTHLSIIINLSCLWIDDISRYNVTTLCLAVMSCPNGHSLIHSFTWEWIRVSAASNLIYLACVRNSNFVCFPHVRWTCHSGCTCYILCVQSI